MKVDVRSDLPPQIRLTLVPSCMGLFPHTKTTWRMRTASKLDEPHSTVTSIQLYDRAWMNNRLINIKPSTRKDTLAVPSMRMHSSIH